MNDNIISENQIKLITMLIDNGFKVLRITENETQNLYSWWIIDEFIPMNKDVGEAPFHTIVGHEITPLMNQIWSTELQAVERFSRFIQEQSVMTMRFCPSFKWKQYYSRSPKNTIS